MNLNQITQGDSLSVLRGWPDESIKCVITSPPYWGLRDYGVDGQLGLEKTPEEYVAKMTVVFREVRRVLRSDGTLFLNLGDSYAGSGRGRDADGTWNPGQGGSKQATNEGSTIGRQVNSKSLSKSLIEEGAIGNAWVKPPSGYKAKDLIGIPWLVAFALRADGWYLRSDIIWSKPNPMPESVTDRPTKSHEYIFLMTKSARYYYDAKAIAEPALYHDVETMATVFKDARSFDGKHSDKQRGHGRRHAGFNDRWDQMTREQQCSGTRNKRSVWNIATRPFPDAHFATFPPDLVKVCLMAGSKVGDVICDPFMGSGTVAVVAKNAGRQYVGIELNPAYIKMAERRLRQEVLPLSDIPLDTRIEEL